LARWWAWLDDLVGLGAGSLQFVGDLGVGLREVLLRIVGGGQAFGDLLLALLDRLDQRRPDELDGEPDEDREADHLAQQGDIRIHVVT